MNIDSIKNGLVIDHIRAGGAMELYRLLRLGDMDCTVAIIKNAKSEKYGKKDIIKIEGSVELAPILDLADADFSNHVCVLAVTTRNQHIRRNAVVQNLKKVVSLHYLAVRRRIYEKLDRLALHVVLRHRGSDNISL